jgi:hypothetical protein
MLVKSKLQYYINLPRFEQGESTTKTAEKMLEIYEETFRGTQKSLYGIFIFCFFGVLILDKFS